MELNCAYKKLMTSGRFAMGAVRVKTSNGSVGVETKDPRASRGEHNEKVRTLRGPPLWSKLQGKKTRTGGGQTDVVRIADVVIRDTGDKRQGELSTSTFRRDRGFCSRTLTIMDSKVSSFSQNNS